jgi:hypothetical protein
MTTVEQLVQHLVEWVFAPALAGDANLRAALACFGGNPRFDADELVFTLPHLHRFLLIHCERSGLGPPDARASDYRVFRHTLYAGDTNTALRRLGAMVVVDHADDDHALSVYRLKRLPG